MIHLVAPFAQVVDLDGVDLWQIELKFVARERHGPLVWKTIVDEPLHALGSLAQGHGSALFAGVVDDGRVVDALHLGGHALEARGRLIHAGQQFRKRVGLGGECREKDEIAHSRGALIE